MRDLVFRPEAEAEILDAYRWYEHARSGLGKAFANAVDRAVTGIVRMPLAHPRVVDEMRRALVRRFPYGVFYEVEIIRIDVLSIMHTRRDPRRWRRRRRSASTAR